MTSTLSEITEAKDGKKNLEALLKSYSSCQAQRTTAVLDTSSDTAKINGTLQPLAPRPPPQRKLPPPPPPRKPATSLARERAGSSQRHSLGNSIYSNVLPTDQPLPQALPSGCPWAAGDVETGSTSTASPSSHPAPPQPQTLPLPPLQSLPGHEPLQLEDPSSPRHKLPPPPKPPVAPKPPSKSCSAPTTPTKPVGGVPGRAARSPAPKAPSANSPTPRSHPPTSGPRAGQEGRERREQTKKAFTGVPEKLQQPQQAKKDQQEDPSLFLPPPPPDLLQPCASFPEPPVHFQPLPPPPPFQPPPNQYHQHPAWSRQNSAPPCAGAGEIINLHPLESRASGQRSSGVLEHRYSPLPRSEEPAGSLRPQRTSQPLAGRHSSSGLPRHPHGRHEGPAVTSSNGVCPGRGTPQDVERRERENNKRNKPGKVEEEQAHSEAEEPGLAADTDRKKMASSKWMMSDERPAGFTSPSGAQDDEKEPLPGNHNHHHPHQHHHLRSYCSHGGMMSSRKEKIFTGVCALVILMAALVLIGVGAFLPKWAAVKNTTADGNVSYSLWAREECFGIICSSEHTVVKWTHEDCWVDKVSNKQQCKETTGYRMRVDTHCWEANYCNSTWIGDGDYENVPSLLFVAKAFQTPAVCSALLSIILYLVKICLLVKRPELRRLHLKAAYLTFGAIAGFAAVVGVVIFCTMLDKEKFTQGWAPYLNVAGGGVFVLFGVGGYLSWRNRSQDEFDDDRSECEKECPDVKVSRPFLDRQTSRTTVKASEV